MKIFRVSSMHGAMDFLEADVTKGKHNEMDVLIVDKNHYEETIHWNSNAKDRNTLPGIKIFDYREVPNRFGALFSFCFREDDDMHELKEDIFKLIFSEGKIN